ncbi:Transporter protein [Mariniradius saccharolyticus AK6]|uniref:Transporter protein n=1 Tax=Mariniradius saccharolyticus AK6 TaxID=1239962 RepID=M7X863_9BACT|nr:Transporter protein [Mariniradius saccharolyticus AK6]
MLKYKTIGTLSEGNYKEKGSRFLSYAFPVKSEEEIQQQLTVLRKKYHDARHHCYAYVLGKEGNIHRANDDGEPNHSAGDPILGQIKSHGLTNVLIVVVRYFGGIKLGVGGLIQAYREAAADALANNEILETEDFQFMKIKFGYLSMNEVMKIVKDYQLGILEQHFDNSCEMELNVADSVMEQVRNKLSEIEGLRIT